MQQLEEVFMLQLICSERTLIAIRAVDINEIQCLQTKCTAKYYSLKYCAYNSLNVTEF